MNAIGGGGQGQNGAGQGNGNGQQQPFMQNNAQQMIAQMMAAQQQQKQQSQGQQPAAAGGALSGIPLQIQQNPVQMLQVITTQIASLQRQWQTVQAQPDSEQKGEATQQLAMRMRQMNAFQAQALQALQRQQQQQQSPQQSQTANNQQQQPAQSQSHPPLQGGAQGQGQQQQQGQAQGQGEANGPAHNAQLAALQAFAQQQRIQAMQVPGTQSAQQGSQQGPQPSAQQSNQTAANQGQMQMQQARPPVQQQQQSQQQSIPSQAQQQTIPGQQPRGDLLTALRAFMVQRNQPFPANMPMTFVGPANGSTSGETRTIDIQTLFATVIQFGGSARIQAQPNGWAIVASKMGLSVAPLPQKPQPEVDANGVPFPSFVAPRLAQFYRERFASFEEFWIARMKSQAGQQQQQQQQPQQQDQQQQNQEQSQQGQSSGQSQPQQQAATPSGAHGQAQQGNASTQPDAAGQSSVQEAARKAQELQAQLPHQLRHLQEMMKSGKMTQDQAKEQYMYFQNAAKMAILHAQAQAAAAGSDAKAAGASANQSQQAASGLPPPSPAQAQPATNSVSTPSGTGSDNLRSLSDSKKPIKRPRKSTMSKPGSISSTAQMEAGSPASSTAVNNFPSTPDNSVAMQPSVPAPQPVGPSPIDLHAQNAIRALHQGLINPAQQIGAFAAIRTAQAQARGGPSSAAEVMTASQVLAQVYDNVLKQAQNNGQPLQAAASVAFAAAQQEAAKIERQGAQNPAALNGMSMEQAVTASGLAAVNAKQLANIAGTQGQGLTGSSGVTNQGTETVGTPTKPGKLKIEYMPVRRDVRTFGGWDIDFVEAQLGPLLSGRGRYPRSVRDLGSVDIEGLIMSLRSRMEVEMTYALNALLILTAGVQAPGFHLLLGLCEDLFDELLDLLEEAAFGTLLDGEEPSSDVEEEIEVSAEPYSHAEWVIGVLENESENKIRIRSKKRMREVLHANGLESDGFDELDDEGLMTLDRPDSDRDDIHDDLRNYYDVLAEDRQCQRQADIALCILEILCNLSVITDNHVFLNGEPRLYRILMRIVAAVEIEEQERRRSYEKKPTSDRSSPRSHRTVFTTSEALRVRKDILSIIAGLAGETCVLSRFDHVTITILFELLASFVRDAGEIESQFGTVYREVPLHPPVQPSPQNPTPAPPPMVIQPFARKVPQHADLALEAFSSLAQPDANRKLLGETIKDERLIKFGEALIRLLPVSDLDFHMLKTEARLGYCERIAMSLFDVAYAGSANVKRQLRQLPGTKGIVFRCIKRLMKVHADFSHNPFSVLTRRLVEMLRVLSDGENMFDRPPLLGFGMESHLTSSKKGVQSTQRHSKEDATDMPRTEDGSLLIEEEAVVVDLMTQDGIDPTIIAELEKML